MRDALVSRYRVPQPRSALATAVRDHASAAMDVSDGLAGDLAKLCAVSGVSADIDADAVPLSAPVRQLLQTGFASIEGVVAGGDDYEILCTIPAAQVEAFMKEAQRAGVAASTIGTIVAGASAPRWLDAKGRVFALSRTSYSHF